MRKISKNPRCWRKLTIAERCIIFVYLTFIGLTELNTVMGARATSIPDGQCFEHHNTAEAVLSKLKPEVEPCDDFYQFACGNFIDKVEIRKEDHKVTSLAHLSREVQKQVKDIISEERSESEPKHFKLPNLMYKACMNKSLIETLGTKPIKQISDSLGGWPVVVGDSWNSDKTWTLQDTLKDFRRLGFRTDYVLEVYILGDLRNNTKYILNLDQGSFGLKWEYLIKGFNESLVLAYYDYMVDMAVLFGAEKEAAKKELRESLQFEMDLANISWPNEKRSNVSDLYNLRTLKQMQQLYPYVQWLDYINALLPEGLKVDENEEINLIVPSFYDDLGKLLQRTDNRVIANYMMWRIHEFSVTFLSDELRKRQFEYATALSGTQEPVPRWRECVKLVSGLKDDVTEEFIGGVPGSELLGLGIAVASLYVRKHFQEDSKATALEMVNNIRSSFDQILEEVDWMDTKTKQEAKRKLHAMDITIGYTDEFLDNGKLAEYYRKLEIDPDKYFESFLNINIFIMDYLFSQLRLPLIQTEWIGSVLPTAVETFVVRTTNDINSPAGIFQGHFFNAQRPKYMNYGAIGYVIGRAISDGFDDKGRNFDADGNLVDWWQPDTLKSYLEKAKCIVEQYGNFTDEQTGLNLNGINTQVENIADNAGIKVAYLAYKQWVSKNGEEPRLPGLDYTPNQMFWISSAQIWCAKYRTESLKLLITTGVYSPDEFRVLGPLRNNKDFSLDFQCPENAPMNPAQKCELW